MPGKFISFYEDRNGYRAERYHDTVREACLYLAFTIMSNLDKVYAKDISNAKEVVAYWAANIAMTAVPFRDSIPESYWNVGVIRGKE